MVGEGLNRPYSSGCALRSFGKKEVVSTVASNSLPRHFFLIKRLTYDIITFWPAVPHISNKHRINKPHWLCVNGTEGTLTKSQFVHATYRKPARVIPWTKSSSHFCISWGEIGYLLCNIAQKYFFQPDIIVSSIAGRCRHLSFSATQCGKNRSKWFVFQAKLLVKANQSWYDTTCRGRPIIKLYLINPTDESENGFEGTFKNSLFVKAA